MMYVDSYNDLAGKTNNENLSKGYEDGLKSVLQLKLDEYGYELEDLTINGSEIETIKIKKKTVIMTIMRTYNLMTCKKKKFLEVKVS